MFNSHPRKHLFIPLAIAIALLICSLVPEVRAQQGQPLTNAAVTKLVRAGFKEKTVIAIIHSRPNRFNLEPDRLIELKRNGVGENIILAMLSVNDANFMTEDGWGSDPFFRSGSRPKNDQSNGEETDIFGSSGGASGESRSRGAQDSEARDRVTTGSATVRIIRPPAEAGGAALKLDKTPTLNNEAIINLVEAGFSEGTIIKRIESSPGEFDLSPTKLTELRKRRVTEPIIAAMTNAMDGSEKPSNPGTSGEN